jgi:molybdate transport system permease protein
MTFWNEIDWSPIWVSMKVAVPATLISVFAGTIVGYLISSRKLRGKRWIESAILLPLVLPPTVLGYYLLTLIGRRGFIGRMWESAFGSPLVFTLNAAIIAACVSTIPLVTRILSAAFASVDPHVTEAAKIDGASGWPMLSKVFLPQVRVQLVAATTIAFARALGDFGTTLMVAGNLPGRTQTAAIAIYDHINSGHDTAALILVLLISAISIAVLVLTSERGVPT